jgi:sulfotransferase family protein
VPWTPPPRSPWTEQLISLGRALGDDGRSLVSLHPEDVRGAATVCTGLADFGDSWWEEPFRRLCTALDEEAQLHLPGRLRTRGELQTILQNRLRLVDLWRRQPAVLNEVIHPPIVVTGLGRSGTTLLHELLACDPDNRPPLLWELLDTVPPTDTHTHTHTSGYDEWAATTAQRCHDEITLMDAMVPAFTAMHENGGHLPTECIFLFAHQFSSDLYTGLYNVGQYTVWRSTQEQSPIYDWHRRMLQTLQWVRPSPTVRWVLKAPSHLSALPLLFDTYPDAKVVITHRDPLRVIGSLADLMATLHYMHSDHVEHEVLVEFMALGLEMQMDDVTAQRDSGTLPADRISDVIYGDLVRQPIETVERLYEGWGWPVSEEFRRRLGDYLAAHHTGRAPRHDYSFSQTGLDLSTHRANVAPYQARFGVPSEV